MIDFGRQRTADFLDELLTEVEYTFPQKISLLNLIYTPDRMPFSPANESNSYILLIE